MEPNSRQRDPLEQLERRRELMNRRLDDQRARINARFDKKQAHLDGQLNVRQQQIVDAALELLSTVGLGNVSLRDVAKRINMQAPALYWHFKNKDDLIDRMAEAILLKQLAVIPPRSTTQTWQDWLTSHMLQLREAMLAYPDGGRVVAGAHLYPALTLGRSFEAALIALTTDGIELSLARRIILTATHYTYGSVIEEQASPTPEQMESVDIDELLRPYPYMAAAMRETLSNGNLKQDYLTGLEFILNGALASTEKPLTS